MEKYLVIMSDNREISNDYDNCDYNSLTAFINNRYCFKNGYDFIYLRPNNNGNNSLNLCYSPSGNLRHSSWAKILSSIYVIKNFNKYDKVVYIDSDCIFNNFNKKIDEHFSNLPKIFNDKLTNPNIIFLNDRPWHIESPCAGFFIFTNNQDNLNFFKTWYEYDDVLDRNFDLNHCWEQWSLYKILKTDFSKEVVILDDYMFVNHSDEQFLRHIGTHEKNNRIPFFKEKIKMLGYTKKDFNNITNEIKTSIVDYNTKLITEKFI
jgi:hypothetical protein